MLLALQASVTGYFVVREFFFPPVMHPARAVGAILGASASGFMLPWVELLTRIRRLRLPLENRLRYRVPPSDSFFPNAPEAVMAPWRRKGFEHATDSGWEWAGMKQFFRIYWNPEQPARWRRSASASRKTSPSPSSASPRAMRNGRIFRTTNFPFSPTLKCGPEITWNHVPCERNCFHQILRDHQGLPRPAGAIRRRRPARSGSRRGGRGNRAGDAQSNRSQPRQGDHSPDRRRPLPLLGPRPLLPLEAIHQGHGAALLRRGVGVSRLPAPDDVSATKGHPRESAGWSWLPARPLP